MTIIDSVKNALGIPKSKPVWKTGMSAAEEAEYQAALLRWQHPELYREKPKNISQGEAEERANAGWAREVDHSLAILGNGKYQFERVPVVDCDAALTAKLRPLLGAVLRNGSWSTERVSEFMARHCGWMSLDFLRRSTVEQIKEAIESHSSREYFGGSKPTSDTFSQQDRDKLAGLIGLTEPTTSVVQRLRLPLNFLKSATRPAIDEALAEIARK